MNPGRSAPANPKRTASSSEPISTLFHFAGYTEEANALLEKIATELLSDRWLKDSRRIDREHALAVARQLHRLGLDHEAVAASVLGAGIRAHVLEPDTLADRFPRAVAALAKGVLTIGAIDELGHRSHPEARSGQRGPSAQNERRRNLLLAMVEDVRVVIIELADRLERLRGPTQSAHLADSTRVAHPDPENLALTARATHDVYAPLASRLGIWQLKWELEALALRALEPDTYRDIAQQLESRRAEREQYIERVKNDLDACLEAEGISSQTTGRAKLIEESETYRRHRSQDA